MLSAMSRSLRVADYRIVSRLPKQYEGQLPTPSRIALLMEERTGSHDLRGASLCQRTLIKRRSYAWEQTYNQSDRLKANHSPLHITAITPRTTQ
jgi:hypothetical protein